MSAILAILMFLKVGIVFWFVTISSILIIITFEVLLIIQTYFPGSLNNGINSARVKYLNFLINHKILLTFVMVFGFLLALYLIWILIKNGKLIRKIIPIIAKSFQISIKNWLLMVISVSSLFLQFFIIFIALKIYG